MSIDNIIVTTNGFHSHNKNDLIASNIHYITKLFQNNLKEDQISQNALKSYYVDYYYSHIIYNGFDDFIKTFQKNFKVLYYIRSGLKALKSHKHLKLFNIVFPEKKEQKHKYHNERLNKIFKKIQKKENIIEKNHQWLISHPKLIIVNPSSIESHIQKHLMAYQNDKRHVQIIKQLCKIIDEVFIAVTAGDEHNIYNRSWYFKTAKNYYYIIEKDHIVTLYNSFTKKEVTKGRLVANKTEQSFVSNFISQILA